MQHNFYEGGAFSSDCGATATVLGVYGCMPPIVSASVLCKFQRLFQSLQTESDELGMRYGRGGGHRVDGC